LHNLSGGELEAAFFRCWTRKEAYIKACGEGLALPLDSFDVEFAAGKPAALLATRPDPSLAGCWQLHDLSTEPGYVAALAIETDASRLRNAPALERSEPIAFLAQEEN
jgi:4'-phosphopantetheinyl transferase